MIKVIGMLGIFMSLVLIGLLSCYGQQSVQLSVITPNILPSVSLQPSPIIENSAITPTIPNLVTPEPLNHRVEFTHALSSTLLARFDYDKEWNVEVVTTTDAILRVVFLPTVSSSTKLTSNSFSLVIKNLPYHERGQIFPRSSGMIQVVWQKPISISSQQGGMYVYGNSNGYSLQAIYYDKVLEVVVQLDTDYFSEANIHLIESIGLTKTIESNFSEFQHVATSFQLIEYPLVARPTSTPIPLPLPQPPTTTTWLTYTNNGASLIYPNEWLAFSDSFVPPYVQPGQFTFPSDVGVSDIPLNYIVDFEIYYVDNQTEANATSGLTEQKPLWEKNIGVQEGESTLAVLGSRLYWEQQTPLKLVGQVYSAKDQRGVKLTTTFDPESLELAHTQGFTETIRQRFQVFEQMIKEVTFESEIIPTVTSTATITPLASIAAVTVTKWSTFTYFAPLATVSVQYPAGANIIVDPRIGLTAYFHSLDSPMAQQALSSLEVIPNSSRVDPHSWMPNEGGYQVWWQEPITATEGLTGVLFIWGDGQTAYNAAAGQIMVMYYSDQYQLDIRLTTGIVNDATPFAKEQEYTQAEYEKFISDNFQDFKYLAKTLTVY